MRSMRSGLRQTRRWPGSSTSDAQPRRSRIATGRCLPISSPASLEALLGDDLDFAVDAGHDVEAARVDLALVLGDGAILTFGKHHARERTDRLLDDVTAGRQHRPLGVR